MRIRVDRECEFAFASHSTAFVQCEFAFDRCEFAFDQCDRLGRCELKAGGNRIEGALPHTNSRVTHLNLKLRERPLNLGLERVFEQFENPFQPNLLFFEAFMFSV